MQHLLRFGGGARVRGCGGGGERAAAGGGDRRSVVHARDHRDRVARRRGTHARHPVSRRGGGSARGARGRRRAVRRRRRRRGRSEEGAAGVSLFDFSSQEGVQFAEYDDSPTDDEGEDVSPDDDFGGAAFDFGAGFDDDGANFDDEDAGAYAGVGAVRGEAALDEDGAAGLEWVVNASLGGKMAWAGPSHWRFKAPSKPAGARDANGDAREEDGEEGQRRKRREKGELTFDFENVGEPDEARFTLAATAEELLLVSAPTAVDTLLPPDLGYDAADLAKLSLRPNAGVSGVGGGAAVGDRLGPSGGAAEDDDGFGDAYDDDAGFGGGFGNDDGDHVGVDDAVDPDAVGPDGLVAAPRRVEKIQVNYARSTKQVDVKELKATLWENITDPATSSPDPSTGTHSFHALLDKFPEDNLAGATEDISVHMAFICMLHLANEHGLKITDRPSLSDLDISNLPIGVEA